MKKNKFQNNFLVFFFAAVKSGLEMENQYTRGESEKKHVWSGKNSSSCQKKKKNLNWNTNKKCTQQADELNAFFVRREWICVKLLPSRSLHVTIVFHSLFSVLGYKAKYFEFMIVYYNFVEWRKKERKEKRLHNEKKIECIENINQIFARLFPYHRNRIINFKLFAIHGWCVKNLPTTVE